MERALFLCNFARVVWFSCNIGFFAHSIMIMDIVEWWENLLNLNDMAWKQKTQSPYEESNYLVATMES